MYVYHNLMVLKKQNQHRAHWPSMQVPETEKKTPNFLLLVRAGEYVHGQQTRFVSKVMGSWSTDLAHTAAESGYLSILSKPLKQ